MKESSVVQRIKKHMMQAMQGSKWVKLHGGPYQEVGLPDLLGCVEGHMYCIEVKTPSAYNKPKHNLSLHQQRVLLEYANAGAEVYVTDGKRWEHME